MTTKSLLCQKFFDVLARKGQIQNNCVNIKFAKRHYTGFNQLWTLLFHSYVLSSFIRNSYSRICSVSEFYLLKYSQISVNLYYLKLRIPSWQWQIPTGFRRATSIGYVHTCVGKILSRCEGIFYKSYILKLTLCRTMHVKRKKKKEDGTVGLFTHL